MYYPLFNNYTNVYCRSYTIYITYLDHNVIITEALSSDNKINSEQHFTVKEINAL